MLTQVPSRIRVADRSFPEGPRERKPLGWLSSGGSGNLWPNLRPGHGREESIKVLHSEEVRPQ